MTTGLPRVFRTPCCWFIARFVGFCSIQQGPLRGPAPQAWNATSNYCRTIGCTAFIAYARVGDSSRLTNSTPGRPVRRLRQTIVVTNTSPADRRIPSSSSVFASSCRRIIRPTVRTGTPHPWVGSCSGPPSGSRPGPGRGPVIASHRPPDNLPRGDNRSPAPGTPCSSPRSVEASAIRGSYAREASEVRSGVP